MSKGRRKFAAEQKVVMLRRHLLDHVLAMNLLTPSSPKTRLFQQPHYPLICRP
jgi:hypothetical protein